MAISTAELASLVEGRLAGDGSTVVAGASPLYAAKAGDVTLLDQTARPEQIAKSPAAAFVVAESVVWNDPRPAIHVANLHAAFGAIVQHFHPRPVRARKGVHPGAVVSPTAVLGPDVEVFPGACIGDDVKIGAGCTIHGGVHILPGCELAEDVTLFPNVVLYDYTKIGTRCIVHSGAVLGAFGFGYRQENGKHVLTAQHGWVELADDVEIGANTTIDRGGYGPTLIGEGTKIDNLVMIGHNCRMGKHDLICSQSGIAGSSELGDYVVLAGRASLRDHIHIGDKSIVGGCAAVAGDVPAGEHVLGIPAIAERDFWREVAAIRKLPELRKQFKALERAVEELALQAKRTVGPDAEAA